MAVYFEGKGTDSKVVFAWKRKDDLLQDAAKILYSRGIGNVVIPSGLDSMEDKKVPFEDLTEMQTLKVVEEYLRMVLVNTANEEVQKRQIELVKENSESYNL